MAIRIRRFTMQVKPLTASAAADVSGARDFSYDDESDWNKDRGDDEAVGTSVRMSTGGYSVRFEALASDSDIAATGYFYQLLVTTREIAVSAGSESTAGKLHTFSNGYLQVGANVPTENPGRITVTGWFATLAITDVA
jgi:hypothetical protein